jgi:hypothetical protein
MNTSSAIITPRLMWGIRLSTSAPSWISIDVGEPTAPYGRRSATYYIDTPEWEYTNDDLSGVGGVEELLDALLAFLSDAAEVYRATQDGRESDNADLFPPHVMEWAYSNEDAIQMARRQQ